MTWFKVDARFHSHPAVFLAGHAAIGLWVRAGSWCAQHSPEGFVPADMLPALGATPDHAAALVKAQLWKRARGGWEMLRAVPSVPGGRPVPLWEMERTDYRRKIPAWLRDHVFERDGHACVSCGSDEDLTLDHIYPWSLGGKDNEGNLRVLCRSCNASKGARI